MQYQINEGSFTVPDSTQDRSVNMLVLNQGPGGLTLVVTRDQMQEGESLDAMLTRQLRTLASQVKAFKQQEREEITVGEARLPGLRVATFFKQNNVGIHQQQTIVQLGGSAVLVLTLTCSSPLTADQGAYAQQLLDSFTPASE